MNRALSWFCKITLKPIITACLIKKIKGLENIPKTNFILAANHQSHLDQLATGFICVPRRFHMIGQIDRYNKGLTKFFRNFLYFIAGVIKVDRQNPESRKKVVEEAIKVLKKGDVLIIYPEGTRTRNGEVQRGKEGAVKIFLKTGVPILPVGIKGAFDLLPPGKAFPELKKIITINIGMPLYFKDELAMAQKLSCDSEEYKNILKKITKKVMEEITNLVGKKNDN